MREKMQGFALIFILQAVIYESYGSTVLQNNNIGLKNAISSMEKAIDFYSVNFAKVNLDSIYGLRIAEGALYKALHSSKSRSLSPNIQKKIKNLYIRTAKVAEKGYRHLKAQNIVYFLKFKPVIRKKWSLFLQPYWSVVGRKDSPKKNDKVTKFRVHTIDVCMTSMMGTNIFGKKQKCNLPKKCWKYMTSTKTNRYTLTHQALYFLISKDQGCDKAVIAKMGNATAVNMYVRYLAARMFSELKKEIIKGRLVKESDKDLFAEQVLFCQILGARECFNLKYLKMITHWQDETGCWKRKTSGTNGYENENALNENEANEQLLNDGMGNMVEDLQDLNERSEGNQAWNQDDFENEDTFNENEAKAHVLNDGMGNTIEDLGNERSEGKEDDYNNEGTFDENEAKEQLLSDGTGNIIEDPGNERSEGNACDVDEEDDLMAEEDFGGEAEPPEDNKNLINDGLFGDRENDDRRVEMSDEDHVLSTSRLYSERMSAEKVLSNGCSSHFSGVSIGVIGNFINWLVNTHSSSENLQTVKDTRRLQI